MAVLNGASVESGNSADSLTASKQTVAERQVLHCTVIESENTDVIHPIGIDADAADGVTLAVKVAHERRTIITQGHVVAVVVAVTVEVEGEDIWGIDNVVAQHKVGILVVVAAVDVISKLIHSSGVIDNVRVCLRAATAPEAWAIILAVVGQAVLVGGDAGIVAGAVGAAHCAHSGVGCRKFVGDGGAVLVFAVNTADTAHAATGVVVVGQLGVTTFVIAHDGADCRTGGSDGSARVEAVLDGAAVVDAHYAADELRTADGGGTGAAPNGAGIQIAGNGADIVCCTVDGDVTGYMAVLDGSAISTAYDAADWVITNDGAVGECQVLDGPRFYETKETRAKAAWLVDVGEFVQFGRRTDDVRVFLCTAAEVVQTAVFQSIAAVGFDADIGALAVGLGDIAEVVGHGLAAYGKLCAVHVAAVNTADTAHAATGVVVVGQLGVTTFVIAHDGTD